MSSEAREVRDAAGSYVLNAEQAVPPGYKRTEVGVIPIDWDIYALPAVCWFQEGPGVRKHQFRSRGVKLLNGTNIHNGRVDLDKTDRYVSEREAYGIYRHFLVDEGDILLATSGVTIEKLDEKVAYAVKEHLPLCMNTSTVRFKPKKGLLRKDFLYFFLQSSLFKEQIERQATGSAQLNFGPSHLSKVSIGIPSQKEEQRAIATALSDVDALITALDKLIAKKRAIKTAAMQQLLTGKIRLPGFSGKWETRRLGELADVVSGGTPKSSVPDYWDGGIFWCTPTDITRTQGKYIYVTERTISKDGLSACSAQLLPPGSILLCTRATIGEMKLSTVPIATNQGFKSLVCKKGVSNEFMYYRLLMEKGRFIEKASGSTFLEISKKDVVDLSIRVPEVEEQTAIAQVLSDMDAEIAALEARRDKTRAIKKGMMQQLLAGKVRLLLLKKSLY